MKCKSQKAKDVLFPLVENLFHPLLTRNVPRMKYLVSGSSSVVFF